MQESEEVEPIESIYFDEFDDGATIDLMSDRSIQFRLSIMPPSWAGSEGPFENFAGYLASALNAKVIGLDKELFSIPMPEASTLEALKNVLRSIRSRFCRQ